MTLDQLANLGEFVGGLAVLVTLIYLVIQVRQNTDQLQQATEVARGTAEAEAAKMNMSYYAEFVKDPSLAMVWDRAYADPESLTPEERARWSYVTALWFHFAPGSFRQYRRGLLPRESWEPVERGLAGVMRTPMGRSWWRDNLFGLATDFRAHVDELGQSYPDEPWEPVRASEMGLN